MSFMKRTRHRHFHLFVLLTVFSLVFAPLWSTPAQAAKEAIYLSDTVNFSLSDVLLSAGTDSQTLRFNLSMANDSEAAIDYNSYGIRVADAAGNSYSVQLSEKTSARVQPHKSQTFKYSSNIASGLQVGDLSVVLFAWDSKEADYMRDIGSLSVGAAAADQPITKQAVMLNLDEVDTTLPDDATVSFQTIGGTKVAKDGAWTMSVDLRAENLGSTAYKLPAGLTYQLVDSRGFVFSATALAGVDTLFPHQAVKLTLQAGVGGSFTDGQYAIQFVSKTTTGTGAAAVTNTSLIGTLSVANVEPFVIGQVRDYPAANSNGITLSLDKAIVKQVADGVSVETTLSVKNTGKSVVTLPSWSGAYQLNANGITVAATDSAAQASYLSPNETVSHTFRATLPDGADMKETSFVLNERKAGATAGATILVPVINANLSAAQNNSSGVVTPSDGTVVNTSAGSLAVSLKNTQRLTLESDDVLLSEIELRNVTSSIITLPAIYGGFSAGDLEVTGKAVRLQSSAYLNPGDSTMIYLYSKIPYSLDTSYGSLFIGEGTVSTTGTGAANGGAGGTGAAGGTANQTVTPSQEWMRLSFSLVNDDGIPTVEKDKEWKINDQGRQSVGAIIDSRVFTLGTQKMIAVRVVQTGKEKRVGNIVPYTGYFIGPDGSIWNAKVTEETGRFCNGCVALSTIWVSLPEAVSSNLYGYDLVLGQKLDDTAITSVHRFSVLNLGAELPIPVAKIGTAAQSQVDPSTSSNLPFNIGPVDLYPYSVSFTDLKGYKLATQATVNRYEVDFTYNQSKLYPVAGGNKNRSLFIELRDLNDVIMKTWDIPFEGTGSLANGEIKLTTDVTSTDVTQTYSPRVYVYEKFEGALRMLGSNTVASQQ